jgi:hypothetical protein
MKVFISHAHADRRFAARLAKTLEAAGHDVWTEREILPGDNWAAAAATALDQADALVALISPDALQSELVKHEWEYALGQERFRYRLIPVEVRRTDEKPWIFERLKVLPGSDPEATGREIARAFKMGEASQVGTRAAS